MYDFKTINFPATLTKLINKHFSCDITNLQKIGEGFYGVVFKATIPKEPYRVILKCYKTPGRHISEADQLNLLRKYSLIKIPNVYVIHDQTEGIPVDALIMEYIDGTNAAHLPTDHPHRNHFIKQMVDNLLHIHSITHHKGFSIGTHVFYPDWQKCFSHHINQLYQILLTNHQDLVVPYVLDIAELSIEKMEGIFKEPIKKSSLIHSDYNLWNILVNEKTANITAVIDPLDVSWADRELDLFHLQNADGDRFGLLDYYRHHHRLSDLFEVKNAFYWFWDDIKHLENMGWYDEGHFVRQGENLEKFIRQYL